jgi:hypothetical protein
LRLVVYESEISIMREGLSAVKMSHEQTPCKDDAFQTSDDVCLSDQQIKSFDQINEICTKYASPRINVHVLMTTDS